MSEKEKKQAIVLGLLLVGFLAFVLIVDPFEFFDSGSSPQPDPEPTATEEEEEEEEEEPEAQPVASASSPTGDHGLPVFPSVSDLEGSIDDPAHTSEVWPAGGGGVLNSEQQYFDVEMFTRARGANVARINGSFREVGDVIVDLIEGHSWQIEKIETSPDRFRALRQEPHFLRLWFDWKGYPEQD